MPSPRGQMIWPPGPSLVGTASPSRGAAPPPAEAQAPPAPESEPADTRRRRDHGRRRSDAELALNLPPQWAQAQRSVQPHPGRAPPRGAIASWLTPPVSHPAERFPPASHGPLLRGPVPLFRGGAEQQGPARVASDALGNGQGRSFSAVVRLPRSARYVTWLAESESAGCQLSRLGPAAPGVVLCDADRQRTGEPGPTTVRASEPASGLHERMRKKRVPAVIATTNKGRPMGTVTQEALGRLLSSHP